MKTIINNKVLLVWLIIILLIINLSAVITFMIKMRNVSQDTNGQINIPPFHNHENYRMQFGKILHFSPEQCDYQQKLSKKFLLHTESYKKQMHELKVEIGRELSSDKPDTEHLNQLADIFANIQSELKKISFRHFTEIKSICTEEQKHIFNQHIKEVVERDTPGPGFQHGRQHRYRNGLNN